jgi:hypothetical protein
MLLEGFRGNDESILKREVPKLVLDAIISGNHEGLINVLCNDEKKVVEWICFAESFERRSTMFRKLTQIQIKLVEYPDYMKHYKTLVDASEKHKSKWANSLYPDLYEIYGDFSNY